MEPKTLHLEIENMVTSDRKSSGKWGANYYEVGARIPDEILYS